MLMQRVRTLEPELQLVQLLVQRAWKPVREWRLIWFSYAAGAVVAAYADTVGAYAGAVAAAGAAVGAAGVEAGEAVAFDLVLLCCWRGGSSLC
ncbi:MAG: hypothetical protein LBF72_00720 [Holosporales bacterium]|jgi:hypothetical protein|nr:hypothetical protein [Holosporales bacterium]